MGSSMASFFDSPMENWRNTLLLLSVVFFIIVCFVYVTRRYMEIFRGRVQADYTLNSGRSFSSAIPANISQSSTQHRLSNARPRSDGLLIDKNAMSSLRRPFSPNNTPWTGQSSSHDGHNNPENRLSNQRQDAVTKKKINYRVLKTSITLEPIAKSALARRRYSSRTATEDDDGEGKPTSRWAEEI